MGKASEETLGKKGTLKSEGLSKIFLVTLGVVGCWQQVSLQRSSQAWEAGPRGKAVGGNILLEACVF